jgi:nitrite reductase (NO-forming)
MLTRRAAAMYSAAAAVLMLATPALAEELKLPRQHLDLVAPPFVHPHEQATRQGPKIMEFTLKIEEKKVVIDKRAPPSTP